MGNSESRVVFFAAYYLAEINCKMAHTCTLQNMHCVNLLTSTRQTASSPVVVSICSFDRSSRVSCMSCYSIRGTWAELPGSTPTSPAFRLSVPAALLFWNLPQRICCQNSPRNYSMCVSASLTQFDMIQ